MDIEGMTELNKLSLGDLSEAVFNYIDKDVAIVTDLRTLPPNLDGVRLGMNAFMLCTRGRIQVDVNGERLDIEPQMVVMLPDNAIVTNLLVSTDLEAKVLLITSGVLQSLMRDHVDIWNNEVFIKHKYVMPFDEYFDRRGMELYYELISLKLQRPEQPLQQEIVYSHVRTVLLELFSGIRRMADVEELKEVEEKRASSSRQLFKRFIMELSSSEVHHRPVTYYAAKLCISPRYLTSVCKRESGKTAMEWIRQYTLDDIRFYLGASDQRVQEVSDRLGFPNVSFFGKYVKTYLGCTPSECRSRTRLEGTE